MKKTAVIILAAGGSSRLGYPKQLVQWKGQSLLQRLINEVNSIPFISQNIVLGSNYDQIRKKINSTEFEIIVNHDWQDGMASSLRIGLKTVLSQHPEIEQVLILLSDQPFVDKSLLEQILTIAEQTTKSIIACKYRQIVGVPALFSKNHFQELANLTGDKGAGPYIKKAFDDVQIIDFEMGIVDIDTTEDVQKLTSPQNEE